jgi:hypothetical protein
MICRTYNHPKYMRKWRKRNREAIKLYKRAYLARNAERINARRRQLYAEKR